ncbi:30S ribosomal protein S4e [Candidatus Woesearchaeota archaeon]|nr:30S ribosomal protein S4e [Candidatus Woesearchaeota archaeon]
MLYLKERKKSDNMVKNHLKTITAPKTWPVKRKGTKFLLRPNCGPHRMKDAVSLNFLLINMLEITKTKKESKYLLHKKQVEINGKRRKDIAFPVGIFDVLHIRDIDKSFRIKIDSRGKLGADEIDKKEAGLKPYKIAGKSLSGKKIQLNFLDGSNMLVDKDNYKVGDSLVIAFKDSSIKEHIALKKGNLIFLTAGRHRGSTGKIEDIIGKKIIYRINKEIHETSKDYAFAIGKDKPVIKID